MNPAGYCRADQGAALGLSKSGGERSVRRRSPGTVGGDEARIRASFQVACLYGDDSNPVNLR